MFFLTALRVLTQLAARTVPASPLVGARGVWGAAGRARRGRGQVRPAAQARHRPPVGVLPQPTAPAQPVVLDRHACRSLDLVATELGTFTDLRRVHWRPPETDHGVSLGGSRSKRVGSPVGAGVDVGGGSGW